MSKIGMLVCGNSGIDYIEHKYDIPVIRSIIFIGEDEYTDFIDIKADEFYEKLRLDKSLVASTAQAATGVILEQYEQMRDKGYDELLVITLSKELSGTYQGCVLAASMIENCKVTVFDTKSVAYPQAKIALDAAKMLEEGKSLEEVIKHMEFIRDNHTFWFSVDTLRYLVKNGRLSGASGFVGSLLKIKPLLGLTKDGRLESLEKIRTTKKSTDRVIEVFLEAVEGKDVEPFLIHAVAPERIKYITEKLLEAKPDFKEIKVYPLAPVVGAHVGPNTIALGYILNK
ncbi:MAG: DegV family protein [Candidatus Izimaplasma sp.]|nr:DegV family protein [Candidatus Izimaplasma bacterium]